MKNFKESRDIILSSFDQNEKKGVTTYNGGMRSSETSHSLERDDQSQRKLWCILAHISAIAGYLLIIPFAGVLGPLLIYFSKGEASDDIKHHSLESVNFQITISILSLFCTAIEFVSFNSVFSNMVALINIVCICWASVTAHQGKDFRYPISLKLIK